MSLLRFTAAAVVATAVMIPLAAAAANGQGPWDYTDSGVWSWHGQPVGYSVVEDDPITFIFPDGGVANVTLTSGVVSG